MVDANEMAETPAPRSTDSRARRFVAGIRRTLPVRRGPQRSIPDVQHGPLEPRAQTDPELRVMTLNLAHGRSTGFHQAFLRRATIQKNLKAVAEVVRRVVPDVVAFQEADGPCAWSGGFDHVAYVAEASGLGYRVRGTHVAVPRIAYGTALASRLPLSDPLSVAFAPSPPTFTKGCVISTITHPAAPDRPVDVVSVHLDFARPAVRRRQVETLIETLRARPNLRVVTGDFNTGWGDKAGVLERLADGLELRAHEPEAPLVTFPLQSKRLDWIFASEGLDIVDHEVLPDPVSDHRGVVATLRLPG